MSTHPRNAFRYDLPACTVAVWFISHAFGVSDYGVVLCGQHNYLETRIGVFEDGTFREHAFADRFLRDYGMSLADAQQAVRLYRQARFDADVRDIVRMNALEWADDATKARAVELGLVGA